MPPKAAPTGKKGGKPVAEVAEVAPPQTNKWVDINADWFNAFASSSAAPSHWAEFSARAYAPCDPCVCDLRDLLVLEYCFTFVVFCRAHCLNFTQTAAVLQLVQRVFEAFQVDPIGTSAHTLKQLFADKISTMGSSQEALSRSQVQQLTVLFSDTFVKCASAFKFLFTESPEEIVHAVRLQVAVPVAPLPLTGAQEQSSGNPAADLELSKSMSSVSLSSPSEHS